MPNVELHPPKRHSLFRKIAIGTFKTAYDPSLYGALELPMEAMTDYMKRLTRATGMRCTVSHVMVKAMAICLQNTPQANALLRFNRLYRRKRIGIFSHVAFEDDAGEVDLSGLTIFDPEKKSMGEIVREFDERVDRARKRRDPSLEASRRTLGRVPPPMINTVLNTLSWLSYSLNLDLSRLGVPRDPFGSLMISNLGSLGLEDAFPALVGYARVPMFVTLGAIRDVPVAEAGQVVVRSQMRCMFTFDHRYFDAVHGSRIARDLQAIFDDPDAHLGPI